MLSLISNIKTDFINFNTDQPNQTRGALWVTAAIVALATGCVITLLGFALGFHSAPITCFLFSGITRNLDKIVLLWLTVLSLGIGLTISGVPLGIGLSYKCVIQAKKDFSFL